MKAWRRQAAAIIVGGTFVICTFLNVLPVSGQGLALDRVMHKKLATSQKMLEAVVTSDWISLEAESRELEALTSDPQWMVLKRPEYARYSDVFRTAVRTLHDAAAKRDLEATPQAYVALTISCVECHRYLARNRIAR
jgi:hypothetical protein